MFPDNNVSAHITVMKSIGLINSKTCCTVEKAVGCGVDRLFSVLQEMLWTS